MAKKRSGAKSTTSAASPSRIPLASIWAAGLFLAAFVLNAALPGPAFTANIITWWTWGSLAVIAAAAFIAWLPNPAARGLPARCARLLTAPSPVVFASSAALTSLALSVAAAIVVFQRDPIAVDELAQLWHAKMLATGRLSLPADPNPEFFAIDNVIDTGRWYSQYPIGGPAVLALGVLIGAPWLVNPVLAAGTTAAIYHFARNAWGEVQGRAIAALLAVTPMFFLMSGSLMNHVPVLFLMSVALAALVELDRDTPRVRPRVVSAVIGLALGFIAVIRPLDAAVAALAIGVFQAWLLVRKRLRVSDLLIQAVAGAVALAPLLYANWATTGSATRFGYNVMWGPSHQIGFHLDPTGTLHTPTRAIAYFARYVSDLNVFALMWPVPALAAAIATLLMLRRLTRWDGLMLLFFWTQVLAYALYWHRGIFIGPRFLFTALPAVLVFIARVPFAAGDRFGAPGRRFALAAVLLCIAGSWLAYWRGEAIIGASKDLRGTRPLFHANIGAEARKAGLKNALVFVNEAFNYRLSRRLWGLGVSRSDAVTLMANGDACSLLAAIIASEADSVTPREARPAAIAKATQRFVPGPAVLPMRYPNVHHNSAAAVTDECRKEIRNDSRFGIASFGPALLAETIGSDGRLTGDVIFAADLGDHNEVLRARFGGRTWYRLSVQRPAEKELRVVIKPY